MALLPVAMTELLSDPAIPGPRQYEVVLLANRQEGASDTPLAHKVRPAE